MNEVHLSFTFCVVLCDLLGFDGVLGRLILKYQSSVLRSLIVQFNKYQCIKRCLFKIQFAPVFRLKFSWCLVLRRLVPSSFKALLISRLKAQLNSFSRSGTRFWNSLPKSVKDSPKFSFKKKDTKHSFLYAPTRRELFWIRKSYTGLWKILLFMLNFDLIVPNNWI